MRSTSYKQINRRFSWRGCDECHSPLFFLQNKMLNTGENKLEAWKHGKSELKKKIFCCSWIPGTETICQQSLKERATFAFPWWLIIFTLIYDSFSQSLSTVTLYVNGELILRFPSSWKQLCYLWIVVSKACFRRCTSYEPNRIKILGRPKLFWFRRRD